MVHRHNTCVQDGASPQYLCPRWCIATTPVSKICIATTPVSKMCIATTPVSKMVHRHTCVQNGALLHFGNVVLQSMDAQFPNERMCREESIFWPPRSPDLSPRDFFLEGTWERHVKNNVYSQQVTSLEQNNIEITAAFAVHALKQHSNI
jgi:hypothetical protein